MFDISISEYYQFLQIDIFRLSQTYCLCSLLAFYAIKTSLKTCNANKWAPRWAEGVHFGSLGFTLLIQLRQPCTVLGATRIFILPYCCSLLILFLNT